MSSVKSDMGPSLPGWHFKVYLVFVLTAFHTPTNAQDCVVEPYIIPPNDVAIYVYHGQVTIQKTWSDNYNNPDDADYKQLYNDIYDALFKVFSCQLNETKDIFYGLTNIMFSKGSVKVDWDLILNEPFSDRDLLSEKAAQELNTTSVFKSTIIDPQIQEQLNFAFATIGAVTGSLTFICMLYGVLKKMKELIIKAKNKKNGGLSGAFSSLGGDKIIKPKSGQTGESTQTNPAEPDTSAMPQLQLVQNVQQTNAASQGYIMPQTYVIADNPQHVTQMASTGQYNNDVVIVQGQGYIMPSNGTMVVP